MNKVKPVREFPPATCLDPIEPYKRQSEALAAAATFALASPGREHVHRLRTATRRMEAQLALLAAVPGTAPEMSKHEKAVGKLGKTLKRVRRAAGTVRDLDVQGKSLLELAGIDSFQDDTQRLSHWLKRRRRAAAKELQLALGSSRNKLVRRMDAVQGALGGGTGLSLPASEIEQQMRLWYRARVEKADAPRTPDALHEVRKVAKLARYMGEANGSKVLAEQFEALQESGGAWHDLLTLSSIARKRLGKRSPLVRMLRKRCADAYRRYCEHLARFAV